MNLSNKKLSIEKKTNELTAFQWLAPSMARDGLIRNGDWVLPAATEAGKLFDDAKLELPAQFLAALHRFAIDYLSQAPVLVIAATYGKDLLRRNDRLEAGRRFIAACQDGPRLPALMQSYGLAPQLRALSGQVLHYQHWGVLQALSKVPASTLAQCIPKTADEQVLWLQCVERWRAMMGTRLRNADHLFEWAVTNLRTEVARRSAIDIVDFVHRSNQPFDPRWTFAQAMAASQRWHEELARRPFAAEAARPDWTTEIDYAPLPTTLEVDGYTFHALRSRQALYEEGAIMNHCVRTYSEKVVRGSSRIYSVRQGERRVATLELVRWSRTGRKSQRFEFSQLKSQRNGHPDIAVSKATAVFIARANEGIAAPQDVSPEDLARWQSVVGQGARSRAELCGRLGQEIYHSWFNSIEFDGFQDGVLHVSFPTRFLRNWVEAHYHTTLLECCAGEFPGLQRVEITLRMPPGVGPPPPIERGAPSPVGAAAAPVAAAPADALPGRAPQVPQADGTFVSSPVDPRMTFDNFVVGSSNRMAHAGAAAIADAVARGQPTPFSSLLVHGDIGLGKTHLLHAIAAAVRQRIPAASVVYLTAERFSNHLAAGLRAEDAPRLASGEGSCDLLLVDDIELLRDRASTPLFHNLVGALLDCGRHVVLSSSQTLAAMTWLGEPLHRRLHCGLIVEVAPPDAALRQAVLQRLYERRNAQDPTFRIAPELLARIADVPEFSDHRTLEGVLTRLYVTWQYMRAPITEEIVELALGELVGGGAPASIKIADILAAVALHFHVTRSDILSERRHPSVVWPRQVGMYLARRLTPRSLPEIGRRFGGRDHTTVLHAIRKVQQWVDRSATHREEIEALAECLSRGRDGQGVLPPRRAA